MSACSHCWARYCTTGLANKVEGNRNKLARCRLRNTPTKLANTYLVKPRSLLPGSREDEAIISISSDPHKTLHLCKY